ncbi:AAA family ATPase [Congregibacter litoralis]|uniref:AAA family ATPase n=1 Tax=Congregibacter litoralis TaxID=393662 RepID=UPI00006B5F16|nr:AAA family ATPase [Congregibacter litoralis]
MAEAKDDGWEEKHAGQSIELLDVKHRPPCVAEHATFMADFDIDSEKNQPYVGSSPDTHGHFAPTPFTYKARSAAAVPFRWMLRTEVEGDAKKQIQGKADELALDWEPRREPELSFKSSWVQEGTNQRIMLETFFSAIKPETSLVFFYAKRTPLSDDHRRVIVGAGRVKSVGDATEYKYSRELDSDDIKGFLWERNVGHSIRDDFENGFILPYQELMELSLEDESIDLEAHVAFAPHDFFSEYSYGSELLPHDGAIASLLECERAVKVFRGSMDGPWAQILRWIDRELNRLWEIRGPFPGFGSALSAFGFNHGTLLAWYISSRAEEESAGASHNPWDFFESIIDDPSSLPDYLSNEIGPTMSKKWEKLPEHRKSLLDLLSRCGISAAQAERFYQKDLRPDLASGAISDSDLLANPYLLYEADRQNLDPILFGAVDRGVFPEKHVRERFPLSAPTLVSEPVDPRRVRPLCILTLSEAIEEGHTLLPVDWVIQRIRSRPLKPECKIDHDLLAVVIESFTGFIDAVQLKNGAPALQLAEYASTKQLIARTVEKRLKRKRTAGDFDWDSLVADAIGEGVPSDPVLAASENKARQEKAAALEEIYQSGISVLTGSAGTGKSTLLKALCRIPGVEESGLLLLAPTGKARVRLEQATGMFKQGQTIAQFLLKYGRYDGETGRYLWVSAADPCRDRKTVIVDECSMLTEDQLAALLSGIKNVERLILVGDPQQLPPIGAGRPFVDIVERLRPDGESNYFPRVDAGYASLSIPRRQLSDGDKPREDLLFADYFSGGPLDPAADEVWTRISSGSIDGLKVVSWSTPDDLQAKLVGQLVDELGLDSEEDEAGFEVSIGGVRWDKDPDRVFFNNRWKDRRGAAESAEDWQILSPLRASEVGVEAINRLLQSRFRERAQHMAAQRWPKIPKPMGPQRILWGDKVINVRNSSKRKVWPDIDSPYVANGDIGVVVGKYQKGKGVPKHLEVELTAQTGPQYSAGSPQYKYFASEFSGEDANPPLELAYALTVHKTQGSEFGTTFLIIPNPCRLLSREMLYTALTRHKDRVVVFHQGDLRDIARFSSPDYSEIARRLTNIFVDPDPVDIEIKSRHVFLDANRIHRTARGERVRSKSEVIIANQLHSTGIDYSYEPPVVINGRERYPDFVIEDDDSGETYYWEHLGMMSDPQYRERWSRKYEDYIAEGILPVEDGGGDRGALITTEEHEGQGLNSEAIQAIIDRIK